MSTSAVGSTTATNPLAAINGSGASSANGSSNVSSATSGVGGLTMNDFLTLMTAQLQNQDPAQPDRQQPVSDAALRAQHGRGHFAAQYLA